MLVGMFTVAVLASVIPEAFHGETAGFALAYAAVRAVVVVLNARAWWHLPAARPLLNVYIPAFSASIAALRRLRGGRARRTATGSGRWRWRSTSGRRIGSGMRIRVVPIHASHIPERVGLFTIIVFGESILAVVIGTTTVSWGLESAAVAALGFVIAGALWWIYFDYVDTSVVRGTVAAGQTYLYAHLPLLIGLAALGAGIKLAIKATEESGLTDEVSWIIGVGVALFMASVAVMHLATTHSRRDVDLWLRVGTAVLALALGALGPELGIVPMLAHPRRRARRSGRARAGDARVAQPRRGRDRDRLSGRERWPGGTPTSRRRRARAGTTAATATKTHGWSAAPTPASRTRAAIVTARAITFRRETPRVSARCATVRQAR